MMYIVTFSIYFSYFFVFFYEKLKLNQKNDEKEHKKKIRGIQFASYFFDGLIFHFTIVPAEIHIVSADFLQGGINSIGNRMN